MAKHSNLSIRAALVLTVFAATTPALGIIAASWMEFRRHTIENAKTEVMRQAEAFAEIQIRISDATAQVLGTLASLPAFRSGNLPVMGDILRSVHAGNYSYLNFTAVDGEGIVIASSLLRQGTDLSGRRHVQDALRNRRFSPGEYVLGKVDDVPSFSYAYPLMDVEGRIKGTVNAVYKLSSYEGVFRQFSLPDQAFLGLVDRNGIRLYYHPARETNPVGKPIKAEVWHNILKGPDRGVFVERGSDGVERYFSYRSIRLDGDQEPYMHVVYGISTASVVSAIRAGLLRNLGLMAAVTVLALGLAAALAQLSFGRRLADIVRTADAIGEGNLSARSPEEDSSADLGRIGAALNMMASTIETRHRELEEYGRRLTVALEEKNILLKEVHHRVKNNLQLILSMLRLQSDSGGEPAQFRETMENRIAAMSLVHEMLYRTENQGEVDLAAYAREIAELVVGGTEEGDRVRLETNTRSVSVKLEKAVPFGLLVNELVTNALKHGFGVDRDGTLRLSVEPRPGSVRLEIADDGPGLPEDFDPERSEGLGLRLASALASQLGGRLRWENAAGAAFSVEFPV